MCLHFFNRNHPPVEKCQHFATIFTFMFQLIKLPFPLKGNNIFVLTTLDCMQDFDLDIFLFIISRLLVHMYINNL